MCLKVEWVVRMKGNLERSKEEIEKKLAIIGWLLRVQEIKQCLGRWWLYVRVRG